MNIKDLTAEMNRFVNGKGWYKETSPRPQTARNLAISLVLEASEVLEHFQWGENAASNEGLRDELADVMLYLLQIASVTGIDLEEAVLEKLRKNIKRQWDVSGRTEVAKK